MPAGDGNGWVRCACGKTHWGRHGAAGLLVHSEGSVLLQLRAGWTHNGGTWALPGGARDGHETAVVAALRETREETTLDPDEVTVLAELVDDHGPWSYTTVLAEVASRPEVGRNPDNAESDALQWWPLDEVATLPLHYGFALTWPTVRQRLSELDGPTDRAARSLP